MYRPHEHQFQHWTHCWSADQPKHDHPKENNHIDSIQSIDNNLWKIIAHWNQWHSVYCSSSSSNSTSIWSSSFLFTSSKHWPMSMDKSCPLCIQSKRITLNVCVHLLTLSFSLSLSYLMHIIKIILSINTARQSLPFFHHIVSLAHNENQSLTVVKHPDEKNSLSLPHTYTSSMLDVCE